MSNKKVQKKPAKPISPKKPEPKDLVGGSGPDKPHP